MTHHILDTISTTLAAIIVAAGVTFYAPHMETVATPDRFSAPVETVSTQTVTEPQHREFTTVTYDNGETCSQGGMLPASVPQC